MKDETNNFVFRRAPLFLLAVALLSSSPVILTLLCYLLLKLFPHTFKETRIMPFKNSKNLRILILKIILNEFRF